MSELPDNAKAKLAALELTAADMRSLAHVATEKLRSLMTTMAAASTSDVEREKLSAEASMTRTLQQERTARADNVGQTLLRARAYLEQLPAGTNLVAVESVPVPQDVQEATDALAEVRERIKSLSSERRKIAGAPKDASELKSEAANYVRDLARRVQVEDAKISIVPGHLAPLQLLAWFDPDALLARMGEDIERQHADDKGIASAERATKLAMLANDIIHAERTEEALVTHLEGRW